MKEMNKEGIYLRRIFEDERFAVKPNKEFPQQADRTPQKGYKWFAVLRNNETSSLFTNAVLET